MVSAAIRTRVADRSTVNRAPCSVRSVNVVGVGGGDAGRDVVVRQGQRRGVDRGTRVIRAHRDRLAALGEDVLDGSEGSRPRDAGRAGGNGQREIGHRLVVGAFGCAVGRRADFDRQDGIRLQRAAAGVERRRDGDLLVALSASLTLDGSTLRLMARRRRVVVEDGDSGMQAHVGIDGIGEDYIQALPGFEHIVSDHLHLDGLGNFARREHQRPAGDRGVIHARGRRAAHVIRVVHPHLAPAGSRQGDLQGERLRAFAFVDTQLLAVQFRRRVVVADGQRYVGSGSVMPDWTTVPDSVTVTSSLSRLSFTAVTVMPLPALAVWLAGMVSVVPLRVTTACRRAGRHVDRRRVGHGAADAGRERGAVVGAAFVDGAGRQAEGNRRQVVVH